MIHVNFSQVAETDFSGQVTYEIEIGDRKAHVTVEVRVKNDSDSRAEMDRRTVAASRIALLRALEAHDKQYPAASPQL